MTTHRTADHGGKRGFAQLGDIGDGFDAVRVQLLGRLRPDAPQPAHRQRVQERKLAIGRDDETPVLVLLLALAAALYLLVWLVERPGDGEGPCELAPVEGGATPGGP